MSTTATTSRPLTPRQRAVFHWLAGYVRDRGYGPTYREGQAAFSFRSPNAFVGHVRALAARGLVTWDEHTARSLRVVCDVVVEDRENVNGHGLET